MLRGLVHELADRDLVAGRDHKVLWLVLLQHQPLHLDVVLVATPVASAEVTEVLAVLQGDPRHFAGDLLGHEGLAAAFYRG